MVRFSATKYSCVAVLWTSLVSFAAIALCVVSQRVFVVVDFVIDSVRNLLVTPTYTSTLKEGFYILPFIKGCLGPLVVFTSIRLIAVDWNRTPHPNWRMWFGIDKGAAVIETPLSGLLVTQIIWRDKTTSINRAFRTTLLSNILMDRPVHQEIHWSFMIESLVHDLTRATEGACIASVYRVYHVSRMSMSRYWEIRKEIYTLHTRVCERGGKVFPNWSEEIVLFIQIFFSHLCFCGKRI